MKRTIDSLSITTDERAVRASQSFLHNLLGDAHPRDFAVRFWDGSMWRPDPAQPVRFTLILQHPGALRRMFLPPSDLTVGEAYIHDDFDIEGEIEGVFELADHLLDQRWTMPKILARSVQLLRLPSVEHAAHGRRAAQLHGMRHSQARDRQAVTYHYNVSNDFYRLWLDERMVYSCAYFATPDQDLDTAQARKLDYICRKLRLQPGERLLDIGCGWGALIIHAARNYSVEALGITLSRPQAELATERIRQAGLGDRCRVEVRDYRELDAVSNFDKLASVGMVEHVGKAQLPDYFAQAWRLLRPGGVFLNHGIGYRPAHVVKRGPSLPLPSRPTFASRYVFPDGELVPLATTVDVAEAAGFEVRDVESLREHYMLTLRHWTQRLEAQHEVARRITDETTYRIWRAFMVASAYGFRTDHLTIYQTLLVKPQRDQNRLPLTRADWYT
jgi:cyclopropane-fatty-acyl-phospholipid synthase